MKLNQLDMDCEQPFLNFIWSVPLDGIMNFGHDRKILETDKTVLLTAAVRQHKYARQYTIAQFKLKCWDNEPRKVLVPIGKSLYPADF